jgi:hypothetical protein
MRGRDIMLAKLFVALKQAGAPEDVVAAAAEEVATFQDRLASLEAGQTLFKWGKKDPRLKRSRRRAEPV